MLRLFIIFVVAVAGIEGSPVRFLSGGFDQDDFMYEDYDLYYDQKQNGTSNVRLNVDGVALLVPVSKAQGAQALSILSLAAMDLLSGGFGDDGTDYYDQEISESPYIEHLAKPENTGTSQESSEVSTMDITPPPANPPTTAAHKGQEASAEENEINEATTLAQFEGSTRKGEKRRFKDFHRRNKHTRPVIRPFFNRFLSRLMPA